MARGLAKNGLFNWPDALMPGGVGPPCPGDSITDPTPGLVPLEPMIPLT